MHEVKTSKRKKKFSEEEFHQQFTHVMYNPKDGLAEADGVGQLSGLPVELRDKLAWAELTAAKYRKATGN